MAKDPEATPLFPPAEVFRSLLELLVVVIHFHFQLTLALFRLTRHADAHLPIESTISSFSLAVVALCVDISLCWGFFSAWWPSPKPKRKFFCFFRTSYLTWLRFHFVFARFFFFFLFNVFVVVVVWTCRNSKPSNMLKNKPYIHMYI